MFTQRGNVYNKFRFFVFINLWRSIFRFLLLLQLNQLNFFLKFYNFLLLDVNRIIDLSIRKHRLLQVLHSIQSLIVLLNQKVIHNFISYIYPLHLGNLKNILPSFGRSFLKITHFQSFLSQVIAISVLKRLSTRDPSRHRSKA